MRFLPVLVYLYASLFGSIMNISSFFKKKKKKKKKVIGKLE